MKDVKGKPAPDTQGTSESANRRRVGHVVHDDRGQASVEWHDAPEDYERPKLEIQEGTAPAQRPTSRRDEPRGLAVAREGAAFNPYQRAIPERPAAPPPNAKRDLRQLSKWIKMMREIEEQNCSSNATRRSPRTKERWSFSAPALDVRHLAPVVQAIEPAQLREHVLPELCA